MHNCRLYGLDLRSTWNLPGGSLETAPAPGPRLDILAGTDLLFRRARDTSAPAPETEPWREVRLLTEGTAYLACPELFEFLVPADGRLILARPPEPEFLEGFRTFLLGQALPFALINLGIEPLHSTVMVGAGGAVGLLGDSGYGKSTLAAALLQAGYRLLTDDLLVLREQGGAFWAYPGPPRLKLHPETGRVLLGEETAATPMKPFDKLIFHLNRQQVCSKSVPLKALLALRPPTPGRAPQRITLRKMNMRRAFLALTASTLNSCLNRPARLRRLFALTARMVNTVSVYSLSYPRDLPRLPEVAAAVRTHLSRPRGSFSLSVQGRRASCHEGASPQQMDQIDRRTVHGKLAAS